MSGGRRIVHTGADLLRIYNKKDVYPLVGIIAVALS